MSVVYVRLSNNKLQATSTNTWIVKESELRDEKQVRRTIIDQCQARIDEIDAILETV
jgi:hypothetical protein